MSAKIGSVEIGNGAYRIAEVWVDPKGVRVMPMVGDGTAPIQTPLDPIAARNFAALLVRAAEEVEQMRDRYATEHRTGPDGVCRNCGVIHHEVE